MKFKIGETVTVDDGPFEGHQGVVKEFDLAAARLRVDVTVFGRPTPIDLESWQVEKTEPRRGRGPDNR